MIKSSTERQSPGHRAGSNEVVVVVEDDSIIRLLTVGVLEELGYRALDSADGNTALRILQSSQRVDLLVTDIGLPGFASSQTARVSRVRI
jgi:CheY-like chemotaxis protein